MMEEIGRFPPRTHITSIEGCSFSSDYFVLISGLSILCTFYDGVAVFFFRLQATPEMPYSKKLDQRVRPLSEDEAMRYLRQVLSALKYFQERGYTYGPVSARNILVVERGQCWSGVHLAFLAVTGKGGAGYTFGTSE